MQSRYRRYISFFIAILMVFSLCTGQTMPLFAEEAQSTEAEVCIGETSAEVCDADSTETAPKDSPTAPDCGLAEQETDKMVIQSEKEPDSEEEPIPDESQPEKETDSQETAIQETNSLDLPETEQAGTGGVETGEAETEKISETASAETESVWNEQLIEESSAENDVTVQVTAPEESFPEGTTLTINPVSKEDTQRLLNTVTDDFSEAVAFDIAFRNAGGKKVEPRKGKTVSVRFSVEGSSALAEKTGEQASLQVLHIDDQGIVEQIAETTDLQENSTTEIAVEADRFSIYALKKRVENAEELAAAKEAGPENTLMANTDSGFHAEISLNQETYSSGSTAIVSVKYSFDQGSMKEGDTVTVSIPKEIASKVRFAVSSQHFSSVKNNGDGTYTLTCGPDIGSALTGSFSAFVTLNTVTDKTTGQITVGDASATVTILPNNSSGTGVYSDAIMKDASENDFVSCGDYDYSDGYGDMASQIGIYDSSEDRTVKYRLYINDKQATMSNVTVVDTLPGGMTFVTGKGIEVTDRNTGAVISPSLYSYSMSGNTLTFSYPGEFSNTIQINYWVLAKGGQNIKYTNSASIHYTSGGNDYQESRKYILQGNNYSATNGEKSVDKTVISSDPDDQFVTYTVKFWDQNGFSAGEIQWDDTLDPNVHYLYSESTDDFSVTYDESTHTVHITNTTDVSGDHSEYVRFVTDFSDVPENTTVENRVNGGNTTKTFKMPSLQLKASKTVDGQTPAGSQKFTFQLLDDSGEVIREAQNEGGTITFDPFYYTEDDLGNTYTYTVREADTDAASAYRSDRSEYMVTVTPKAEYDEDGNLTKVHIDPVITQDGSPADSITFENRKKQGSLTYTKTIKGDVTVDDLKNITFTVRDADGNVVDTAKLGDLTKNEGGTYTKTITVAPGQYTVTESNADVAGYNVQIGYSVADGKTTVEDQKEATVDITDTYTKQQGSLTYTKTIKGNVTEDDLKNITFTVRDADGNVVDTAKLGDLTKNEGGTYTKTITVAPGQYTVTESNADVAGYNVQISYSVADGKTTVEDQKEATVDITNTYTKQQGSMTYTKTIKGDVTEDDLKNITFTVTDADGNVVDTAKLGDLTKNEDGTYSKTITVAPGEYTVTESNAEVAGYNVQISYSVADGKTTVEDQKEATVDITDTYTKQQGSMTYTKTIKGNVTEDDLKNITFTVTDADGNVVDTAKLGDLTKNEDDTYSKTITVAPGEYTVTESNADVAGYNVQISYSVADGKTTVEDQKEATVDITDTYTKQQGSLTYTKTIKGNVTEDDLKNITFTVTDADGNVVDTAKLGDLTKNEDGTYSKTITVAPGEYTVTESNADVAGYNVQISYSVADGKTTVEDQKEATVDITNTYTKQQGSLTYTKTIKGNVTEDDLKNITFTVRDADGNVVDTAKLADLEKNEDGTYTKTITVAPGEYTVTESNAEVSGYNVQVSYSVADGKTTVEDQKEATVDITNTYTKQQGSLTYTKTIKGNVTEDDLKNITFTVTDADGNVVDTAKLGDLTKNEDGTYTKTITVAPGQYTVTESNADISGYNVIVRYNVKGGKVDVKDGGTAVVEIVNTYDKNVESETTTPETNSNKPTGQQNTKSKPVKTGDSTPIKTTLLIMITALAVICGVLGVRRHKKN